jgi:hypothetical protein
LEENAGRYSFGKKASSWRRKESRRQELKREQGRKRARNIKGKLGSSHSRRRGDLLLLLHGDTYEFDLSTQQRQATTSMLLGSLSIRLL